eukprot:TRINITY_DN18789_c0_g1_i1.p1 TRINITY_DN18789_c0_g1~~TRINITY_DN18789_c0_g1_i1.p1  ORF type:complete len:879 (+),score=125.62 TRINITY_DN18789_c0_g1_i1:110-2746(+)
MLGLADSEWQGAEEAEKADGWDAVRAVAEEADLGRTISQQALLRWHAKGQKTLSVGLELECFLPDLGALAPDYLLPVKRKQDLFALVADALSERLAEVEGGGCCSPSSYRCRTGETHGRSVSAEDCDWGRLWTATADGSIQPHGGANPFPVELVSKRMQFNEFDVTLFCDVVHALRSPPLKATTNESTGLHVHLGRHPRFFSVDEVAAILKAYLRFEPVINQSLLPVTRQKNRFCRDFQEALARSTCQGNSGHGNAIDLSDAVLFARIDEVLARIKGLSPENRGALLGGCRGALAKDVLLSALLGEGTLWRTKVDLHLCTGIQGQAQWVPPGMVLHEVSREGKVLWRPPSSGDLRMLWGKDGAGGGVDTDAELPTPVEALMALGEEEEVQCLFRMPKDVSPESLDLWLLRDGLILDRHGARYCKLNIMRIALPSHKATLEFRQFPGGDFSQTLLIWGWVKFLGLLVTHACAAGIGVPGADPFPEATEQQLKRFLQLSSDTMLLAWYRDIQNRLPRPPAALASIRTNWEGLWAHWAATLQRATRVDGRDFLIACTAWRRIFQAASGMKALFPATDSIWEPLTQYRQESEEFMLRAYGYLEESLRSFVRRLRAAEEASRVTSLATVVRLVFEGGQLRQAGQRVRVLQASITETLGWDACGEQRLRIIADLGREGSELTLDYARNLLKHLERGAAELSGHASVIVEDEIHRAALLASLEQRLLCGDAGTGAQLKPGCSDLVGFALPGDSGELQMAIEFSGLVPNSTESLLAQIAAADLPITLSLRATSRSSRGPAASSALLLLHRTYHELCSWLLVPRVEEAEGLWAGLAVRGWTTARVLALNQQMSHLEQCSVREVAAAWFDFARTPCNAARPPALAWSG